MHLIVFFNLKPGQDAETYEKWAREVDVPTVTGLNSVTRFDVFKSTGLFGSDAAPPYKYVEVIDIPDPVTFGQEAASDKVQEVARAFQEFADQPTFMICDKVA